MRRLASLLALAAGLLTTIVAAPAQAATSTTPGPLQFSLSGPDRATVGQSVALSLLVTNTTSAPITSVTLGVAFSQTSARLVAPLPNPDLCGRLGNGGVLMGFQCVVARLDPGASASVPFALQPLAAGTLSLQASAAGYVNGIWQTEANGLTLPVAPAPTDVQISGSASTGSPAAGTMYSYTFQVKNGSGQPAYGVSFSTTLPAGASLLAASTDTFAPCTLSGSTVSCALGDLGVGSQSTIQIGAAAPSAVGTYVATASAYPTNADSNPANNAVSVTIQVK